MFRIFSSLAILYCCTSAPPKCELFPFIIGNISGATKVIDLFDRIIVPQYLVDSIKHLVNNIKPQLIGQITTMFYFLISNKRFEFFTKNLNQKNLL